MYYSLRCSKKNHQSLTHWIVGIIPAKLCSIPDTIHERINKCENNGNTGICNNIAKTGVGILSFICCTADLGLGVDDEVGDPSNNSSAIMSPPT
mmetsp:Transcript_6919/g.9771  ORF Transcript_6919/g.9771 Transcript_6919/m.9771 type:complete len:94 (-) Transcript_6919:813-1094(-)